MRVDMRQRLAEFRLNRQGRESARDSTILTNDRMLVLALEILDISDQLPLEAVDLSARDVKFWKAFALEAGKCTTYSEVGSFLPRLHAKILPPYISSNWTRTRYHAWKVECECSETANTVETLTQELIGAVLWDKVKKLWSSANQSELTSSEWQHWKGTIFEGLQQKGSAGSGKSEVQVQNFPGVENTPVRARRPNFATGLTLMNVTGYDTTLGQGLPTNREHAVEAPACDPGHLPGSSYPSTPVSLNESGDCICIGITKHGVRCTHKTKGGALYCGKHAHPGNTNEIQHLDGSEDDMGARSGHNQDTGRAYKRKRSSAISERNSSIIVTPTPTIAGSPEGQGRRSHLTNTQGVCRGWSRRTNAQCARRAGKFSLYCQKHMKACEGKTSNDVDDKGLGDTVIGMAADSPTYKEHKDLARAKDLLHGYLSAAGNLCENGSFEAKKESLIHKASSDLSMAQSLLFVTSVEQGRLRELRLNQQNTSQPELSQACLAGDCDPPGASFDRHLESSDQKFSVAEDAMGEPCVIVTAQRQLLKCALCEGKFDQTSDLSRHWSLEHDKQASRFLKGFGCRVCRFEASNSLVIERHWQKQHKHIPLDWPCWSLCISCENLFANEEELWQHVAKSHAEQLSQQVDGGGPDAWKPFQCSVNGGQPGATWRCTTSYKDITSDVELSGPEGGEQPNIKREMNAATSSGISEHLSSTYQLEACQPRSLETTKTEVGSPEHLDGGSDGAPGRTGHDLLAHVSPKPVRVKEKKVASRGRGRGRKTAGVNGRRQNNGSESEPPSRSSELLLKRRRFKLTSRGQFENHEEDTSGVGVDAVQSVVVQSMELNNKEDAPSSNEEGVELRQPGGNNIVQDCRVTIQGDVQDGAKHHANVQADLAINESLGNSKTSLLCSEELDASASKARCIVLSQDISSGQEPVWVPCVVNIDVLQPCTCALCQDEKECDVSKLRPWESFVYVTKRLLDPSLGIDTKEFQLGCSCGLGNCVPELCDHVKMFDNDNHDACDLHGHPMRGRFPYDKDGRIIVQEGFLVYECNTSCQCSKQCENRVLQNGVHVKLEVYKTKHKGWAVRAAQAIPQGTFVCEYIGEVLNNEEANKRGQRYDQLGCSYLYDIDVHLDISDGLSSQRYVIDATKYGNVSRFINHSCSPNLVNYQVLIESMDCRLAHIGLYASRDIAVGEELAYDYRYKLLPGKGCLCQCGSPTCRGRLY